LAWSRGLPPEQEDDIGRQFLVGQLAAIFLGLHQLRCQIVSRIAPTQLEQLLEIHLRHRVARIGLLDFGRATAAPDRAAAPPSCELL